MESNHGLARYKLATLTTELIAYIYHTIERAPAYGCPCISARNPELGDMESPFLSDRIEPIIYPDGHIARASNLPNKHKYTILEEGEVGFAILGLTQVAHALFPSLLVGAGLLQNELQATFWNGRGFVGVCFM